MKIGSHLNVLWKLFKILKWKAGVSNFRRRIHLMPVLVKSPVPMNQCKYLYVGPFLMCFGFVTTFFGIFKKNKLDKLITTNIYLRSNLYCFSWINMINKNSHRPVRETIWTDFAVFHCRLEDFIWWIHSCQDIFFNARWMKNTYFEE